VVKNVQGAVNFDDATAKNIAVDGSTISDTNNYSVILAGAAEQNATALNIVNSAGGMVSNGLNIAHSTNINAMPTLTQVNSISQVR
jgi:ATP-dependent protease ClpP protease subunit